MHQVDNLVVCAPRVIGRPEEEECAAQLLRARNRMARLLRSVMTTELCMRMILFPNAPLVRAFTYNGSDGTGGGGSERI